jgi:hypothetical protein
MVPPALVAGNEVSADRTGGCVGGRFTGGWAAGWCPGGQRKADSPVSVWPMTRVCISTVPS